MEFMNVYKETSKLDILFVEDDLHFQLETLDILQQLFKSVTVANDGEEALDLFNSYYNKEEKYFDIVISDIRMPKKDGILLTKNIYSLNKKQAIIILSAHNETEYLMKLINLGIKQFLMKPLEVEKILQVFYNIAYEINTSKQEIKPKLPRTITLSKEYVWDNTTLLLNKNQKNIKLSNYEREILQLLIKNSPKVTTPEEILNTIWKDKQFDVRKSVVKSTIHRIRQKAPEINLENISKLGYRLIF